jgi:hypothetical protein
MPATHEAPLLTIYRSGLVNLNGEATRALAAKEAESISLLPPSRQAPNWMLIPASEGLPGPVPLHTRSDRGNMRFRTYELAVGLFAALPKRCKSLRLQLEPGPLGGWHLVAL